MKEFFPRSREAFSTPLDGGAHPVTEPKITQLPERFTQRITEVLSKVMSEAGQNLSSLTKMFMVAALALELSGCSSPRVMREVRDVVCEAVQGDTSGGWRAGQQRRSLCREAFDVIIVKQQENKDNIYERKRDKRELEREHQQLIAEAKRIMERFKSDVESQLREIQSGRRNTIDQPLTPEATLPLDGPRSHLESFWNDPSLRWSDKVGMVIYATGWQSIVNGSNCGLVQKFLDSPVYHMFFKQGVNDAAQVYCRR
ncbi:hypothetical protein D6792_03930 [Candidatus Parcubacteria bacterium]|nr:MAG: hypothetical protein D6792_03930 [Candidatus Parcubacteria bacterium]